MKKIKPVKNGVWTPELPSGSAPATAQASCQSVVESFNGVLVVVVVLLNEFDWSPDTDVARLSTINDKQSKLDERHRRLHVMTSLPSPCDVIVALPLTSSVVALSHSSAATPQHDMPQSNNKNKKN